MSLCAIALGGILYPAQMYDGHTHLYRRFMQE